MQLIGSSVGVLYYFAGQEAESLHAYLRELAHEANILPWSVLSETFATPDNVAPGIAAIYTDLDTTQLAQVVKEEDLRLFIRRGQDEGRISAQAMAEREARLLLLGDPGSGKSTFVKHMAYLLAVAAQTGAASASLDPWSHGVLLPVYVELRAVAAFAAERKIESGDLRLFKQYLKHLLDQWGIAESWRVLREALEDTRTRAILLLDGLDEVSSGQRKLLVEMVNGIMADEQYGRHRCIVTCRPYAYFDMPADHRLHRFAEAMLAPFSEEQVDHFIDNWYSRLASGPTPAFPVGETEKRRSDLQRAVRRKDHRSLARRPILLTMMVQLHTFKGSLPNDRIRLYKESVDLLLARWNSKSHGLPSLREFLEMPDLQEQDIEKALYHVAYRAHLNEAAAAPEAGDEDRSADIDEGELQAWVRPYLGGSDVKAALFIQYIRERAGLLVRHKNSAYTFPHRSLQEFLAACHLVRADEMDYKVDAPALVDADAVRWREVFVLAAGYAARYARTSDAIAGINELCARDCPASGDGRGVQPQQWTNALVAAEALLEIGEAGVKRTAAGGASWERLQGWLLACMRQPQSPAAIQRAAAGRLLARLGDPRIEVLDPLRMEFCYVPRGRPFMMGDGREQRQYDVPYGYWIGRYPVTARQFAVFVNAGGYREAKYWAEAQEEGLWRAGKFRDRERPDQYGEPFELANHPVVGVSWYEALAFVRWLDAVSAKPRGWALRLPSEPEWEKAARGGLEVIAEKMIQRLNAIGEPAPQVSVCANSSHQRKYPWGEGPDPECANYADTKIGNTSAVGCFGRGASPYGGEEMSGNVWEWTRSLWAEYPYPIAKDELAQRENLLADRSSRRVLRGGSYVYGAGDVRCAFRDWNVPNHGYDSSGFRVVASPSTSGL